MSVPALEELTNALAPALPEGVGARSGRIDGPREAQGVPARSIHARWWRVLQRGVASALLVPPPSVVCAHTVSHLHRLESNTTVHPSNSQRVATWEKRLKAPVVIAATAVLPLVALGLSQPTGAWQIVESAGHWAVWLTFVVEVAIMLAVVDDRRAWTSEHRLELVVVVLSSPLVPLALAVAPALRLLVVVKAFKALKLSKAVKLAKLHKSVRLLRRKLTLTGAASITLGLIALALGGLTTGYMVTGSSPLKGAELSAVLVAGGVLVTFGVNHLKARSPGPRQRDDPRRSLDT